MPENSQPMSNAQTVVVEANDFEFEALEQNNGLATVVRFKLHNPDVRAGDVLLVLAGDEVQFHGMIGRVEDGWGTAADRTGSQLPAAVH
jgi:hypothetical protein